jgi:HK97 family phage major capsid protein
MNTPALDELRARRDALATEARALLDDPDPNTLRLETLNTELEQVSERIEQLAALETRIAAGLADGTVTLEPGDASGTRGPQLLRKTDPWAEASYSDTADDVRTRGLAAIEQCRSDEMKPEDRARVQKTIRDDETTDSAEYIAAASSPHYMMAFRKIVRDPSGRADWTPEERHAWDRVVSTHVAREMAAEQRAALTTTGASAILPVMVDPTILLSSAGARGDFRSFSRTVQISTHQWNGATSAGVTAEWNTESAEVTDASPTITAATITPVRGDAYVQCSWEVVQDSNFAEQLPRLLADAKFVLEQAAFATGAGGTASPEGIVTRLSVTTASKVSAQTNGSFGPIDAYALVNNLPARFLDNSAWAGHWGIANLARAFAGTALNSSFWVDFGAGIPSTMLGAPFHQVSGMISTLSAATASSDYALILGDWSQFVVVDRFPMSITSSNWVIGANRRPTGEYGYLGIFRTGSGTPVPNAFRVLVV